MFSHTTLFTLCDGRWSSLKTLNNYPFSVSTLFYSPHFLIGQQQQRQSLMVLLLGLSIVLGFTKATATSAWTRSIAVDFHYFGDCPTILALVSGPVPVQQQHQLLHYHHNHHQDRPLTTEHRSSTDSLVQYNYPDTRQNHKQCQCQYTNISCCFYGHFGWIENERTWSVVVVVSSLVVVELGELRFSCNTAIKVTGMDMEGSAQSRHYGWSRVHGLSIACNVISLLNGGRWWWWAGRGSQALGIEEM